MVTKAKRRAITPIELQKHEISAAIGLLKRARSILRNCGSKNAADYVARALKSAEGALRHAKREQEAERYRLYVETGDERLRG